MKKSVILTFLNRYTLFFVLIFIISLLFRLIPSLGYNFPFTMDQARDMLDIRNIVVGKHLTLIGPTTSINGVFLGPFWYYFNIIPFILGQGNPSALVYWVIFWQQLTGIILFFYFKKRSIFFALITSSLFLMSPALFYGTRYSWSCNPAPMFMVLYFIVLDSYLEKPFRMKNNIMLGLLSGIILQIEAAFGILIMPFTIIIFLIKKIPIRQLIVLIAIYCLTLMPQLVFEMRHDFIMTKTLLNNFKDGGLILGNKLTFPETINSHLADYLNTLHGTLDLPTVYTEIFFFLAIIFLLYKLVSRQLAPLSCRILIPSLTLLFFSFVAYLFFPYNIKSWFIFGLTTPFILILSIFLYQLTCSQHTHTKVVIVMLLIILASNSLITQSQYINPDIFRPAGHQSLLKNELAAIDWVYQNAQGQPFKAFVYLPSVYDYPYQYLFWWYGKKQYGYHPAFVSYSDNVPEYITNNESYWTDKKKFTNSINVFLIAERDDESPFRRLGWLGGYSNLCLINSYEFPWKTEVRHLQSCK